jgi:hypothetical protein
MSYLKFIFFLCMYHSIKHKIMKRGGIDCSVKKTIIALPPPTSQPQMAFPSIRSSEDEGLVLLPEKHRWRRFEW